MTNRPYTGTPADPGAIAGIVLQGFGSGGHGDLTAKHVLDALNKLRIIAHHGQQITGTEESWALVKPVHAFIEWIETPPVIKKPALPHTGHPAVREMRERAFRGLRRSLEEINSPWPEFVTSRKPTEADDEIGVQFGTWVRDHGAAWVKESGYDTEPFKCHADYESCLASGTTSALFCAGLLAICLIRSITPLTGASPS
jgi:hypothetical protein